MWFFRRRSWYVCSWILISVIVVISLTRIVAAIFAGILNLIGSRSIIALIQHSFVVTILHYVSFSRTSIVIIMSFFFNYFTDYNSCILILDIYFLLLFFNRAFHLFNFLFFSLSCFASIPRRYKSLLCILWASASIVMCWIIKFLLSFKFIAIRWIFIYVPMMDWYFFVDSF